MQARSFECALGRERAPAYRVTGAGSQSGPGPGGMSHPTGDGRDHFVRTGPPSPHFSAAAIIFCATGAARPLPLTSERAAPESSIITATATCFPVEGSFA